MEDSVPPGSLCCFCLTNYDEEALYGKFYKLHEITTHYFCLLLSSKIQQRGTDEEGILGFLALDIRNEIRRGRSLCCAYCGKRGATISCYSSKCRLHFHLPCGRARDTFHQFFGEFKSFCCKHRRSQKIKKEVLNAMSGKQSTCSICLESVPATPSPRTLWAPCCSKEAWFHRLCIQRLALSAGYFFKCPLCNNTAQFVEAMRTYGIWIPEQDASWERDPERYEGLLQRHNSCDAKSCRCKQGRTFHLENTKWEIKLCADCGSQGMHLQCGNLRVSQDWVCSVCAAVASKDKSMRSRKILQTRQALMDRNRIRRSLPSRLSQRLTRRSGSGSPGVEVEEVVERNVIMTAKAAVITPSSDKETPSDPPRGSSAQAFVPIPTEPKEMMPENSRLEHEHANSDVEIVDVTENSDDDIQRWRAKKNAPLTCLCKGNKRPYWSRSVHHAVGSSISSCCYNRHQKYIHHGKPSATSIKNSDNELLSRFFSSLTSCPGTSLEKGEPRYHHLWIIHHYQLDCCSERRHLAPRKLAEPRGLTVCDDASSTVAPESSSRGRGRKRFSSISCEDKEKKPEPTKSQTPLQHLPNNARKVSPGANMKTELSREYFLRRSHSHQQLNQISQSLPLSPYSLRSSAQQLTQKLNNFSQRTSRGCGTSVASERSQKKSGISHQNDSHHQHSPMKRSSLSEERTVSCERQIVHETRSLTRRRLSLSQNRPSIQDINSKPESAYKGRSSTPLKKNSPLTDIRSPRKSSRVTSSRGRSWTPYGRSYASSKKVVNSSRAYREEIEESKSTEHNTRAKRKRSSSRGSVAGNIQRKHRSAIVRDPENHAIRSPALRDYTTDNQPSSSGNCTNLKVYDGLELAQLPQFQPVVVLERFRTISRRARSESVEREFDQVKRSNAGRSRREQFTSHKQLQESHSSDFQEIRTSTNIRTKRSGCRTFKNTLFRSPVRTRSRSRSLSMSEGEGSFRIFGNSSTSTSTGTDMTVSDVPENLDSPGDSSYLIGGTFNEIDTLSMPKSPSIISSEDTVDWDCHVEEPDFLETVESIPPLAAHLELRGCEGAESTSSDDSSSVASFKQYRHRAPTPPPRCSTNSSPCSILPSPVTDPCSSVSFRSLPPALPTLSADSVEVPVSTIQISSDCQQSSSSPLVMSLSSSTVLIESAVASTSTSSLSAIELIELDIPSTSSTTVSAESTESTESAESAEYAESPESAESVIASVESVVNVLSPRRSPRSLPFVPTYCVTKRTSSDTGGAISVRRSSPPPIFPRRSGSPTEMECRMKARALTARKFVPMSRVATEQQAMLRRMQVSHEKQ